MELHIVYLLETSTIILTQKSPWEEFRFRFFLKNMLNKQNDKSQEVQTTI